MCVLLSAVVVAGSLVSSTARADDPIPDLSTLSFTGAFDSLCAHYSKHYAFSDWKGIDWPALYGLYAPEVQQAEAAADTARFRLAMKRFASGFADGHVRLRGTPKSLYEPEIGGGFGLTLIQLSDARIAVNRVLPGGPAHAVGIEIGAIVESWGGATVESALEASDIVWEGNPPATTEAVRLAKLRRLVRAPVGSAVDLTFANPGQAPVSRTLTAVDDSLRTWELGRYTAFATDGNPVLTPEQLLDPVTYAILPSGIGYLRSSILVEFDENGNVTGRFDGILASLHEALSAFHAASVPGLIVDLRDNPGGFDRLAAIFGGSFYDHTEVYEHASFYDPATGRFEVVPQFTLYLEPQASSFDGNVVCLVNTGTASSAEGVAMAIQRLPVGHVMGFYGTHGSFGLVAGESALPAGMGLQFTLGRSLDGGFGIQIDADHNRSGGIVPDVRIPLTVETVQRKFGGNVDVELEAAEAFLVAITPVRLQALQVDRLDSGALLIWEIAESSEEAAFHVWRQEIGTARIRLSSQPIAGTGTLRYVDVDAPDGQATYWLQEVGANGHASWVGSVSLLPSRASQRGPVLHWSRPSLFSSATHIPFDLSEPGHAELDICDVRGRVVRVLKDQELGAGSYSVEWDGCDDAGRPVTSGVYFCRLTVGHVQRVRKITLSR